MNKQKNHQCMHKRGLIQMISAKIVDFIQSKIINERTNYESVTLFPSLE